MGDKCGIQVVDKCKLSPKNPEWETSVGDKWETSVNSAQRTQSGRQVWETSVGDKCKLSPKNPEWETSVGDKCGRQVCGRQGGDKWKTSETHAAQGTQV